MKQLDIVYFVKPDLMNEELRFSLRSVEANFPHRSVWFYGGQPIEMIPDRRAPIAQHGRSRYDKVKNMLIEACENQELTEDFWLFNDDFFILQPQEDLPAWYDGTLYERIVHIEQKRNATPSDYTQQLRKTVVALEEAGKGCLNYAVHVPMKINRRKMLKTIERFPSVPMFRALYGNDNEIGGIDAPDVKIHTSGDLIPEGAAFVSTSDSSFINGEVGKQIRALFTEKSRWEV